MCGRSDAATQLSNTATGHTDLMWRVTVTRFDRPRGAWFRMAANFAKAGVATSENYNGHCRRCRCHSRNGTPAQTDEQIKVAGDETLSIDDGGKYRSLKVKLQLRLPAPLIFGWAKTMPPKYCEVYSKCSSQLPDGLITGSPSVW
jgi:hypothetical protein